MSHPDPRVAEAVERTARELAAATTPPPAEVADLADDPAAYLAWLRERPAPQPAASQRPRQPRRYLDRARIPRKWGTGGERLAQPSPHPAPGTVTVRPDGYDAAVAVLRRLDDFGTASLEAARAEHPDWLYGDLVLHAAAHPVVPDGNGTDRNTPERSAPDAPACACGTALDPDGSCFTCTTSARKASA